MVFSIEQLGLAAVFPNPFLAGSIVPFPSEPSIILATKFFNPESVLLVSLIGGFLGNLTNYFIGLKGLHNFLVKREPGKEKNAQKIFDKYGYFALLIAPWVPFLGDPINIVAGALRMEFRKFLLITFVARVIKTSAVVYLSAVLFSFL